MLEPKSNSRWNVRHSIFFRLAKRHQRAFHEYGAIIGYDSMRIVPDQRVVDRYYGAGFSTIVFSGLSAESLIYDFSARYLGDTYTENHLDKLDLLSKWVVVPRLVCGVEIPRDKGVYMLLRKLVSARNDVAHSKTKDPPFSCGPDPLGPWAEKIREADLIYKASVDDCISAVREATTWLYEVSNDGLMGLFVRSMDDEDEE